MARSSSQFDQFVASLSAERRTGTDPDYAGIRWHWTKSGIYPSIVLSIEGKQRRVAKGPVGMKRGDAVKLLNAERKERDDGEISSETHTFAQAYEETLADMKSKVSVGLYSYAYAYRTFPNHFAKHLEPRAFAKKRLDQIDAADIRKLIKDMRNASYGESTINGVLSVIRTTFKFARSNRWTTRNPFAMLGKNDLPDQNKKKDGWVARTLQPEEMRRLIEKTIETWQTLVTLLVYTGMRSSEAIGLHWRDIDLVDGWISVKTQLVRTDEDDDLDAIIDGKTKSPNGVRLVAMRPEVLAALEAQLEYEVKEGRGNEDDWVFTCANGSPRSTHNLRRAVANAAKLANLGKVIPRDLRRSVATLAANKGKNDHHAAAMLGHDVSVYRNTYVQKSEQKVHAQAVVGDLFE